MDFDFSGLYLDWEAIASKLYESDIGMVVPWTPPADINNEVEWEEKKYIQCSVMFLRREVLDEVGGLDESFNTAYSDWDLITRLWNAGYKIVQHNNSFAIHAPAPKNQTRKDQWKKDYQAYTDKHGDSMKRREQPPKIVVADSNGNHFEWLDNFCDYIACRGFAVQKATGWNKDANYWKAIIANSAHVFLWNGAHPTFTPIIEACNELAISYSVLEVGWFPQKEYYFVDAEGINCRSTIIKDSFDWVGKRQYDKLEAVKEKHIGDRHWKGGDSVLVPLQLEEDMNWVLDGVVQSTQDFINHVQERFSGDIIFKKHPLDNGSYKLKGQLVEDGDFLDMAQTASLVYGVNSTCLLEASLMGVPVKSVGGGYLRAHESQTQKLLAVLADKQISVKETNIDYWLNDILAQAMEDELGYSEIPWGALTNSAIVIVPCRNCEAFIGECLDSLISQTWSDLGVIVIDDCSDDNTAKVARKHLKGIDHLVIKNAKRRWALRNIDTAITSYCEDENSVIFLLDGDDYLIDDTAVEKMMRLHKSKDVVWSSYKTDVEGWSHTGGMMDAGEPIRKQLWNMSPFRSFKKFLFDAIDRNQFIDEDGSYFKVTWDQSIMFCVAEMCSPDKWHFLSERFYYYRMHANNDHAEGVAEQKRAEAIIRNKSACELLNRYKNYDVTVVVSCYNQIHVLPFFLESMFFQNRLPKEVIIADDGSDDGTGEWLNNNVHRYPFKISYLTRENNGYRLASLNNFASKDILSGRILFTNADVIHSPNSIFAHSLQKGVLGGVVIGIDTPRAEKVTMAEIRDYDYLLRIQEDCPSARHNRDYIASTNPQHNPIGVWGGNFSVPADKFHKANGFDEGFQGWGGEDNELVRRLARIGCKVGWAMDSKGIHLDHETRQYAYDQEGSNYYLRKLNG
jgi:glycosyltransferase involved in cell wall biosynthesis